MPTRSTPKAHPDVIDQICAAVKEMTAERQSRTYAGQWIMVSEIAARLGVEDVAVVQSAIREAAQRFRLKTEGNPVHSVTLIDGWDEE
jgi:hypothetical protein